MERAPSTTPCKWCGNPDRACDYEEYAAPCMSDQLMHSFQERKPTSEAPQKPGTYINVRTTTTYRWLAYKPDGARQMKALGRWQRATEHGWENAKLPEGDFIALPKDKGQTS